MTRTQAILLGIAITLALHIPFYIAGYLMRNPQ